MGSRFFLLGFLCLMVQRGVTYGIMDKVVKSMKVVNVVGAGLAGSEAAWQLASNGYRVKLWEMRPQKMTPAHKTAFFGELICSN